MNDAHEDIARRTNPASGPNNPPAERSPVVTRVSKSRKGKRYQSANALTVLIQGFQRCHPNALVDEAWTHFVFVAGIGIVILCHDPATDSIAYIPRMNGPEKWIKRTSFARQFYRLRKVATE